MIEWKEILNRNHTNLQFGIKLRFIVVGQTQGIFFVKT